MGYLGVLGHRIRSNPKHLRVAKTTSEQQIWYWTCAWYCASFPTQIHSTSKMRRLSEDTQWDREFDFPLAAGGEERVTVVALSATGRMWKIQPPTRVQRLHPDWNPRATSLPEPFGERERTTLDFIRCCPSLMPSLPNIYPLLYDSYLPCF